MAILCPELKQRFFDNNGAPLAGGKLYSYQAGTSTPLATYTDTTEGTPNANPVILDANGYADVWIAATNYKFVLADANNVVLWTKDNISGIIAAGSSSLGMGALDGHSATSSGAAIQSNTLYMQSASASEPGLVNTTTQTLAGDKTFSGNISAANLSGTNSGDLTLANVGSAPSANGASLSGQQLTLQPFDSTHPGVVPASGGGTTNFLRADGSFAAPPGGMSSVSVASANGLAGSSSGGTTPTLTLSTSVTGLVKGNGTAFSAATAADLPTIALTGDVTGSASGGSIATTYANAVPANKGGTTTSVSTAAATASANVIRDSNANFQSNNVILNLASTATAAGTTTLTVASEQTQVFTGTTTQTVVLPVASTLSANHTFRIINQSTGAVAVQTSGTNSLVSIPASQVATVVCVNPSGGTGTASWNYTLSAQSAGGGSVTAVSIASANGFAGSSSGGTTPALTLSTTVTGILKGNGTAISAASGSDLPTIALTGDVTGSAGGGSIATTYANTVGIGKGGTGQTTQQAAIDALTGTQSSGKYLRSDGTHATLTSIQAADVPTLNQNTTGTASNVTGTVAIANGGTGQTSASAALAALLPTQTGNNGRFLGTDGSSATWTQNTAAATATVVSKTTTYSINANDSVVLCSASGGAFTVTLPTAVGQSSTIKIQKTDTTFNAVTVGTTSSQNITDLGSSATTTTLNTVGEEITLASDNTGWQVIERRIPSKWISDNSAITPSAGFGSLTATAYFRRREGDSLRIRGSFNTGASVAASTGSFAIGNSLTIDSAKLTTVTNDVGSYGGGFSASTNFTSNNAGKIFYDGSDTANVYIAIAASSTGYTKINVSGNMNTSSKVVFDFTVPISGWKA